MDDLIYELDTRLRKIIREEVLKALSVYTCNTVPIIAIKSFLDTGLLCPCPITGKPYTPSVGIPTAADPAFCAFGF